MEDIPEEYDDEALADYAEELELLDGLTPDDIFTYSDVDEVPRIDVDDDQSPEAQGKGKRRAADVEDGDVEMDL